jgi:hypothetical protein
MHEHVTLLRPDVQDPEAPALAFFLAGNFPMLLVPADRAPRDSNHVKPACCDS